MAGRPPLAGPIIVLATFTMPKPTGAPKLRKTWPDVYPDGDKLERAFLDALTDGGVYKSDGQVVAPLAVKCYPDERSTPLTGPYALEWEHPLPEPGVHAVIARLAWVPGETP